MCIYDKALQTDTALHHCTDALNTSAVRIHIGSPFLPHEKKKSWFGKL